MNNSNLKDKKEIKELVYITLFGKNRSKKENPFARLFPIIYKFIVDYKAAYGDYRIISHKLQNLESDLVFNKIVNKLRIDHPEIHLITVHDSIIGSKKYKDIITEIFTEKLSNEFSNSDNLENIKSERFNIYTYV
jgi:hypothetical protein